MQHNEYLHTCKLNIVSFAGTSLRFCSHKLIVALSFHITETYMHKIYLSVNISTCNHLIAISSKLYCKQPSVRTNNLIITYVLYPGL